MDKQPTTAETNSSKKSTTKSTTGTPTSSTTTATKSAQSAKASVPWIFLGGLAIVAGGVALAAIPRVSRDLGWITNNFAKNGIYGAQLALTGMVVCAIGLATRSRKQEPEKDDNDGKDLVLEQLASDLALTRGTMQDLRVEFVYLKDAVQTAANQAELRAKNDTTEDATQSAIFRLAASIDQLAGQTDQRAKAQDAALHENLKSLRAELEKTSANVSELRAQLESAMQSSSSEDTEVAYHTDDERQIEIPEGYEASESDLHVVVDMEDESPVSGLGLLDELDDLGTPVSAKRGVQPSIPLSNVSHDVEGVRGALPAPRGLAPNLPLDEKMAALRALMADPNVRRALESSRNGVH